MLRAKRNANPSDRAWVDARWAAAVRVRDPGPTTMRNPQTNEIANCAGQLGVGDEPAEFPTLIHH